MAQLVSVNIGDARLLDQTPVVDIGEAYELSPPYVDPTPKYLLWGLLATLASVSLVVLIQRKR